MGSFSILQVLMGLAVGGGLAFAAAYLHYAPRLRQALQRAEQLSAALNQTNEMLLQARKQTEAVQKELENARRNRTVPQAAAVRLTEPRPNNAGVVVNSAFADTLLQTPPQPRKAV